MAIPFTEDNQGKTQMLTHLVEVHGYLNVNGQVFKRKMCFCGKPALYVGGDNKCFCKEHYAEAQIAMRAEMAHVDSTRIRATAERIKEYARRHK